MKHAIRYHNSNLYDKTEHATKHKQIDVDNSGEVRENTLTYRGPSGRSGIRTGTCQDYTEYNSNANTQWPQSSTDNRNEINNHGNSKKANQLCCDAKGATNIAQIK
jgi:hypothetical protein